MRNIISPAGFGSTPGSLPSWPSQNTSKGTCPGCSTPQNYAWHPSLGEGSSFPLPALRTVFHWAFLNCSLSGPYPGTYLAWETLPGAIAPDNTAPRMTETSKCLLLWCQWENIVSADQNRTSLFCVTHVLLIQERCQLGTISALS